MFLRNSFRGSRDSVTSQWFCGGQWIVTSVMELGYSGQRFEFLFPKIHVKPFWGDLIGQKSYTVLHTHTGYPKSSGTFRYI